MGYISGSSQKQNGVNTKPTYALEHLVTFKINDNEEIEPKEGMKRLFDLERTNGVWSHKMLLRFDSEWVLILDRDTEEEIEAFPAHLIFEPNAFISKDPKEHYNNVLVFTVKANGKNSQAEMHLFQVDSIPAIHIVEDLRNFKNGKTISDHHQSEDVFRPNRNYNKHDQYGLKEMVNKSDSKESFQLDITILNHCFEDIEKFVARLHYTTNASRELNERKQNRSSTSADYGYGMLMTRARPPKESEFIDIFAKFKLTFNLIAKLKKSINDIKVPIHLLFISLQMIVEISKEQIKGSFLPPSVIEPLLTIDAINSLSSTVNDTERNLWISLGDAWNLPQEQWNETVEIYRPVFYDGWAPFGKNETNNNHYPSARNGNDRYALQTSNSTWLNKLQSRNVKIAQVSYGRNGHNEKELTVVKDEYLEILNDDRKWWKARNSAGEIGYVPHTIVVPFNYERPLNSRYRMSDASDLQSLGSFDEPIMMRSKPPETILEEPRKSALKKRSYSTPTPIPLPPPLPDSTTTTPNSTLRLKRDMAVAAAIAAGPAILKPVKRDSKQPDDSFDGKSADEIQEELKQVLLLREKRKNFDFLKTPQIYIEETSTASEVENWLRGKGFSENSIKKLNGLKGNELFALSPSKLEEYFGAREGRRLVSQITLQKKFSGYKTTKTTELKAVLAKARQKIGDEDDDEENEIF